MIRVTLAVVALAALASAAKCPDGYQLMAEKTCIRPLNLWVKGALTDLLPQMTAECAKDDATLPIIRSAQENFFFNQVINTFDEIKDKYVFLMLGMVCNPQSRRLVWADNTPIIYTQSPPPINLNFDCVADQKHVVSRVKFNDWFFVADDTTLYTYTFLCQVEPTY